MSEPRLPSLAQMREKLRAGMTRDQFFFLLDELAEDGLRLTLPTASSDVVGLPVAEGGELLCFLGDQLTYVEYQGGVFLEFASEPT